MKSFFKKFSGKTPSSHEIEGDELFAADLWGKAKIEYERALQKLERTEAPDPDFKARLQKKIRSAKEALARGHKRSADDMLDSGFYDDARELYLLALELTEDPELQSELEEKFKLLDHETGEAVKALLTSEKFVTRVNNFFKESDDRSTATIITPANLKAVIIPKKGTTLQSVKVFNKAGRFVKELTISDENGIAWDKEGAYNGLHLIEIETSDGEIIKVPIVIMGKK